MKAIHLCILALASGYPQSARAIEKPTLILTRPDLANAKKLQLKEYKEWLGKTHAEAKHAVESKDSSAKTRHEGVNWLVAAKSVDALPTLIRRIELPSTSIVVGEWHDRVILRFPCADALVTSFGETSILPIIEYEAKFGADARSDAFLLKAKVVYLHAYTIRTICGWDDRGLKKAIGLVDVAQTSLGRSKSLDRLKLYVAKCKHGEQPSEKVFTRIEGRHIKLPEHVAPDGLVDPESP